MKTRTRTPAERQETSFNELDDQFSLEQFSAEELEEFLFDDEEDQKQSSKPGIFNLPTLAGLSMIVVGIAYMFQQLGFWGGASLESVVNMLPWLAGILIILLGFGVLSWRPKKKKKKMQVRKTVDKTTGKKKVVVESSSNRKRLSKSSDKKIAGVAGGLAEYFNIDPTLVRIAFVIATFFNGIAIPVYLILAFIMSKPEGKARSSEEERITIIRDS